MIHTLLVLTLSASLQQGVQSRKLNDDFTPSLVSNVLSFRVTPDGARVLYRESWVDGTLRSTAIGGGSVATLGTHVVDYAIDPSGMRAFFRQGSPVELYSAPVDGSAAALKLSGTLPSGGLVLSAAAAPGGRVVYLQRASNVYRLFAANLDGSGAPVLLSGALALSFFDAAPGFFLVADERVLFLTATSGNLRKLVSAPLDGGSDPIDLTGAIFALPDNVKFQNPAAFRASPDGARVVYVGNDAGSNAPKLFSVPCDGSAAPRRVGVGGTDFAFTPDAQRVLFLGSGFLGSGLWSARSDGRGRPRLLDAHTIVDFAIAPGGERVLYRRYEGPNARGLYALDLRLDPRDARIGTAIVPVRLSAAGHEVLSAAFTPDGTRAVFESRTPGSAPNLQVVPADGSAAPRVVSAALDVAGGTGSEFEIDATSARVVFRAITGSVIEVYSAPLDGSSAPVRVHPDLAPYGDVVLGSSSARSFSIVGDRVVYNTRRPGSRLQLFVAPLDGGSETALNAPLPTGVVNAGLRWFSVSPTGEHALYVAPQDPSGLVELFRAPLAFAGPPVRLNAPLVDGGEVMYRYQVPLPATAPVVTPDGSRVLYLAQEETLSTYRLCSVPIDGVGPKLVLSGTWSANGPVRLTADATRVVFRVVPGNLWAIAPIDGSAPPSVQPSLPGSCGEDERDVRLTADGSRFVMRGTVLGNCMHEIFCVQLDGSGDRVRLSPTLTVPNVGVPVGFELSPDGTRVVFLYPISSDFTGIRYELYSAPIDGSEPAAKLNGPLVAGGGSVWQFRVSPDSASVVYRTDQDVEDKTELYLAPIDGSAPPLKLNQALTTLQDVDGDVSFTLDGARVLYAATRVGAAKDLYSVPLDGSTAPVRLTGTFDSNGGMIEFELHPDGEHVVYLAQQQPYPGRNFFRMPIAGGATPVLLNDPAVHASQAQNVLPESRGSFQLSPDGDWLLFRSDRGENRYDLYATRATGVRRTVRVNPPTSGAAARDQRFTPDSRAVVYMLDEQEQLGARELFLTTLPALGVRPR